MAIDKGYAKSMNNLALMYENQEKINEAEKYYLMAIDKGFTHSMYDLALIYKQQGKLDEEKKYYLMVLKKNEKIYLKIIKKNNNDLELFSLLLSIEEKDRSVLIKEEIARLMKIKQIINYFNKINLNSKQGICSICFDENIKLIPFDCSHFYCTNCYITMGKCAICID